MSAPEPRRPSRGWEIALGVACVSIIAIVVIRVLVGFFVLSDGPATTTKGGVGALPSSIAIWIGPTRARRTTGNSAAIA